MNKLEKPKILLCGVFSYLIITNSVLAVFGYDRLIEINPIFKLSLGCLLIFIAFFISLKHLSIDQSERNMFYLIVIMLFVNMIIKGEYQITNYVSAIIFPVCLSCLLNSYRIQQVRKDVKSVVMLFFYIECGMAIIERMLMRHIIGVSASEETIALLETFEFRSNALWGHPLSNSSIITFLLPFILLDEEYTIGKRNMLWGLGMLALLCFNSRMAIVCSAAIYVLLNYKAMFHSRKKFIIIICMGFIAAAFVYALFYTPLGGRLLNLGLYGDSSSMARTDIWGMFDFINLSDYIFMGIPYSDIIYIQYRAGLDYLIIENPWIIFILRYGIIQTVAMVLFYIPIFRKWLLPYGNYNAIVISFFFFVIVSSSNSLAVGSTSIAQLFLFAYAFRDTMIQRSSVLPIERT